MTQEDKIKITKQIAILSGALALLLSILLLINYVQTQQYEPLESAALKIMVEHLQDEPANSELKQDIRTMDLLARKAFFTGVWQIKIGSTFLLFSAICFVFALRYHRSLQKSIELPPTDDVDDKVKRKKTQQWLLVGAITLFAVALLAASLTQNHLQEYDVLLAQKTPAEVEDESIELIEITSAINKTVISEDVPDSSVPSVIALDQQKIKTPAPVTETQDTPIIKSVINRAETEETDQVVVVKKQSIFPTEEKLKKEFTSFRGYNGNGVSFHKNCPTQWDVASGTGVLWKVSVPKNGFNSPVIWENKLFVTGADKAERVVFCYQTVTGELLWQKRVEPIQGASVTIPQTTEDTGLAAPTVTTDGQRVYAIFGTGELLALTMDGQQVWSKHLGVPDNHYGHSSSLICYRDKIFVQYDTFKGGKVFALAGKTGDIVWSTERDANISWASPILAKIDDKWQLILSSEPIVAGYDVESGKELWKLDCMMGEVGPSPAYANGLVFATNEYAKLIAFEPAETPRVAWESDEYLPEVASPVVSDGLLFIATSYGVVACYDAHTGNKYWEQEFDNGFYASPMVAGGNVYLLDTQGVMHIMRVAREAKMVAENDMGEPGFASPSFTDGRIFVRLKEHIYCLGEK